MSKTGLSIRLVGEEGNAFAIIGRARLLLKRNGMSHLVQEFTDEATSSDYDHLLDVVLEWFDAVDPTEEELQEVFDEINGVIENYGKVLEYEIDYIQSQDEEGQVETT